MALKEDYKDAVFAGLRKYKMLDNGDGTVSPVDMTEYENGGDKFGAKDVNAITKTVNATGEIIADDNDEFKPNQKYEIGRIVIYDNKTWRFKVDHEPGEWDESQVERTNILAVIAEQNKNFGGISFGIDGDGNYGYYGADGSLIPFKTFNCNVLYKSNSEVNSTTTYKSDKHRTILLFANAVGGTGYYPSYSITSDKSNITKIAEYYVAYGGTEFSSKSVLYKIDLEEGESVNVRLYYRGTFIILG